jgi:predicted enzyme related to lactoylglutathione lyase
MHVVLAVSEVERAYAFYHEVFGWSRTSSGPASTRSSCSPATTGSAFTGATAARSLQARSPQS